MRIDSHQHFWKFESQRDSWITDEMQVIRRDFLPQDLQPLLKDFGFEGCVVVQSDQSEAENEFQLNNYEANDFVKGVVGWVDLCDPGVEDRLNYYTAFPGMKGFRHVLQGEEDRAFMLRPDFIKGIRLLKRYGFTYDILVLPDQLEFVHELVGDFPDQPFVIDHLAKPFIRQGVLEPWKEWMHKIAAHDNVFCKISGMVTEADWNQWKAEDFYPYLDSMVESFGINRLMFGSDWPVCEVAGGYEKTLSIVQQYFASFSRSEQEAFFGDTATGFYNL